MFRPLIESRKTPPETIRAADRYSRMDIVALIAERKIEEGLQNGAFDGLPPRGRIDCSLLGELFFAWWFRQQYSEHDPAPESNRR